MPILTTKGVYGLMAIAQIANASKFAPKISFYDIFHTLEKDFKMTNLDVKDEILQQFFKNGDKKLKELFSSPISDIIKSTEDSSKNLDFAI